MQHIVALYYRINVYFYSEDNGAEMYVVAYHIVFAMKNRIYNGE